MTLLATLSLASFIFVLVFTVVSLRRAPGIGQSPASAIIEAWANIVLGFTVNFFANLVILPLVGLEISHGNNFLMGWIYTAVSIVRQYALRRWFNARLHAVATRIAS
jgi:hypothetical protein